MKIINKRKQPYCINVLFETDVKAFINTSMTYVSSLKCVHSLGPK